MLLTHSVSEKNIFADYLGVYLMNRLVASAGRHQACLPSWRKESFAHVYARYVSSEI